MQYSKLAVVAAIATPFVAAQNLSGLPQCAQTAALSSISSTGCQLTDIKCICSAASYLSGLQQQISTTCSPAEQQTALAFAQQLCGSAGVSLSQSAASSPSSTAAASSSMMSSAPASTMMTSAVAQSSAAVVSAISDGQPQAPTSAAVVSVISDGQPQAPTSMVAVSQISDGQPQAGSASPTATASAVSQITDGQPQAPTAAPAANTTTVSNVTAVTTAQPSTFTGAASNFGVQWIAAGAVGAAAVFFAGL